MARFPFRRSVGEDLRDLFAHDRLQAQANDLGYSSLGPDDGSFDVVDANGTAVARYGHVGTKSGFLVPGGGGSWITTGEQAQAIADASAAALSDRLDSHASRLGAAEGRLDSHASRIGAAENDISALQTGKANQSTVTTLAGRVGALETEDGKLKAKINSVIDFVLDLEEYVRSQHPGKVPANPPGKMT